MASRLLIDVIHCPLPTTAMLPGNLLRIKKNIEGALNKLSGSPYPHVCYIKCELLTGKSEDPK